MCKMREKAGQQSQHQGYNIIIRAPWFQSNLHHVMELAILEYEQVAGPLGDKEAIHTKNYYTKMYRLQSLYNYITTRHIIQNK